MILALVVVILMVGTVAFHFLSPWKLTAIASNWDTMDQTINLTFLVTGIVFVLVNLFLAYAVYRYRHRQGNAAHYEPENKKLEGWLTGITTVGIVAMLAPGLAVWAKFVSPPASAAVVEALGQQWNWSYRLPGKDGALGASNTKLIGATNPFGIDPNDPKGQDDVLVPNPELHLPLDKDVKFVLRSIDVLHQYAVPQFRVKMDMVPGTISSFWLKTTREGSFDALCEQLCGVAHFAMRGRVVVEKQEAYDAWAAQFPTFAQVQRENAGDAAVGQALYAVCAACHGDRGQGNRDLNAPKLAGQTPWYLARQLRDFKHGRRGGAGKDIYGQQMAPMAMTLADDAAIKNVVAYIGTLQDERPQATVHGNPERGKALYESCVSCHGAKGLGIWSTNAPRLSNMDDWYLQRQLQNFKDGVRGAHPQDYYGAQMSSMSKALVDANAINDVVDYLHTL